MKRDVPTASAYVLVGAVLGAMIAVGATASAKLRPEHARRLDDLAAAQVALDRAFAEPAAEIENVRRLGLHLVRVADVSGALLAQHRTGDALRALTLAADTLGRHDVLGAAVRAVGKLDDGRPDADGGLPGYVIPPFLTTGSAPR